MYLTSTQLSKNKKYRDCLVYHASNLKENPMNVTQQIADKFWLKVKEWRIRIYFGSWSGYMVLKQLLEQHNKDLDSSSHIKVYDISVF